MIRRGFMVKPIHFDSFDFSCRQPEKHAGSTKMKIEKNKREMTAVVVVSVVLRWCL